MHIESRQPVQKQITPREAEEFLAMNNFPGQRKYNVLKGRLYAENMAAGTHRRIDIAVCRVKATGVDYMMNGQHNCQAILIYGKPYQGTVSYYSCETMEDAWRLFATFDVHASRTEIQFMGSRRGIFQDERLRELPIRTLQVCGSALYALGAGTVPVFKRVGGSVKTAKADHVERFHKETLFVAQFGAYDMLMRVGIVAAMIATYRRNAKEAQVFWDRVGSGADLKMNSPEWRLSKLLSDSSNFDGLYNGELRAQAQFAACVLWWNSYRTNDGRKLLKIQAMRIPPKVEA